MISLRGYCHFHQSISTAHCDAHSGILPADCNLVCCAKTCISNSTAGLCR